MRFIFDVDGTLTPSRQRIDLGFEKYFMDFCEDNEVYFVTGSDRQKTLDQLGVEIYDRAVRVYNCSGNSVWEKDVCVHGKTWVPEPEVYDELIYLMMDTKYPYEFTGRHIEGRPGCLNFSVVGRNADWLHRQKYKEFDKKNNERAMMVERFNSKFPDLQATIGGETGLDIFPKGWDKSQIAKMHFEDCSDVYFFGDKMEEGGNDLTLAEEVIKRGGQVFAVTDYKDTWDTLLTLNTNFDK